MEKIKGWKAAALVSVSTVGFVVFGGTGAFAAGTDPVGSYFSDLTSTITTTYIPAVLLLALAGVGVFMGIRWVKKGASKA